MAADGQCIHSAGTIAHDDLPAITGLESLSLHGPSARTALAGALRILREMAAWPAQLSEISWNEHEGYTLFLAHRPAAIRLGWEPATETFSQVWTALEKWPAARAAVFDARFANQIIIQAAPVDPQSSVEPEGLAI